MIGSRVSKRYARALFDIGQEDGNYAEYGGNLEEFARFCSDNPEYFQVISNPVFSVEDRKRILEATLEKSDFSATMKNFLRLLLEKNRIGEVEGISNYYGKLMDESTNVARANIITARTLKDDAMGKIVKALENLTSKTIKTEVYEDPSLIGGVVVKMGDMVLDGSIKTQLEGLKESLKRGEYR